MPNSPFAPRHPAVWHGSILAAAIVSIHTGQPTFAGPLDQVANFSTPDQQQIVSATRGPAPAEVPPDPHQLLDRVIKRQKAIKSGHFAIDTKCCKIINGEEKVRYERKVELWIDGDSIRSDVVRVDAKAKDTLERHVSIVTNENTIMWHGIKPDGRLEAARTGASIAKRTGDELPIDMRTADPRMVGLVPEAFTNLVNFSFDECLGRKARQDVKIDSTEIDKIKCWRVSFTRTKFNDAVEVLLSKSGEAILNCKLTTSHNGVIIVANVRAHHGTGNGASPIPAKCVYTQSVNGKVELKEETAIKSDQVGKEIPLKAFTIEGIGLPVGTKIRYPDGSTKWWDGEKPVVTKPN